MAARGAVTVAAVDQLRIAADADEPAPRALADQRTDARLAEVPWQRIAARARHLLMIITFGP